MAPVFRPPAEANSMLVHVEEGCPYNRCVFCGMYNDIPFRELELNTIIKQIKKGAWLHRNQRRVFLTDGDAINRSTADLLSIASALRDCLPQLSRINSYATGRSIRSKSDRELRHLKRAGFQTLYLGVESGDDQTLAKMKKGETAAQMLLAANRAQAAGLRLSVMILLGLGGDARSKQHIQATAELLNRMQPRLLSALRVVPVQGTPLAESVCRNTFNVISEQRVVEELYELVQALSLQRTVFRANHSSNVIPIEARLPTDKPVLLQQLTALLNSGTLDRTSPGSLPLSL